MSAWTDNIRHYNTSTASIAEGAHAQLKGWMQSSISIATTTASRGRKVKQLRPLSILRRRIGMGVCED